MFENPLTQEEEEIEISKYIENRDNIVFVYDNNRYFFTTRNVIMEQKETAMRGGLYDLKKIGFIYGYPCNINILLENKYNQLFSVKNGENGVSYMNVAIPSLEDN